jgi:DNA glycosylase AlkZ-like
VDVAADQALAFRVAGHHLDRRVGAMEAVAAIGLQQYPPEWGALAALRARSEDPLPDGVLQVNSFRGAPYLVPRADARVFTAALVPGDAETKALVGAVNTKEARDAGFEVNEALQIVADAARDGLADGPLGRDDFHQALRERVPKGLLPWCQNCQSHHVRPGFWRTLGLLEVTYMPAKATFALATPPRMAIATARAELVRRFLRVFGPATPQQLATWAQTGSKHAKALFAAVSDELVETSRGFVLAEDLKRLESPPAAKGVRLLGGYDPWLTMPDRDALVEDTALRKRMFVSIGRPGVVLVDGALAGLWKGRKQGKRLEVGVEWLGPEADIAEEAAAMAAVRGCEEISLRA